MTQIHNIIKNEKYNNIKYALEDLERNKSDTIKVCKAVKKIKRLAPKENLNIKTNEALTSNEKKQSEIIPKHFENIFYTNATSMQNILPTPMSTLFTSSEIRKAVCTLKNKSPRMDQINKELIKYSPEVVYEKVGDIYIQQNCSHRKAPKWNNAWNLKSTTKAMKTERIKINTKDQGPIFDQ